jgi:hypothetical protein
MPFEMDYTINSTNHPKSYWLIKFLSLNDPNKTGNIIFFGYHDVASFDAGEGHIAEHRYDITDPAFYDFSFGFGRYPQESAFFFILEDRALDLDLFFDTADVLSFVKVETVEVGSAGSSTVIVSFPVQVNGANFTDGVTIKINGVAATIVSAARSPVTTLTYTISEVVEPDDTVTWEYVRSDGVLEDESSVPLQSFTPVMAGNTVGEYLHFDDANNSIHLAHIF